MDPRGRFRVDGEAKRFFDYFLLAEGELTDSAIRQRVLEALEHRVPAEAVSQGMDVYDRYVGFRRRAAVARATPGGTPEEGIAALRALEDEAFGEDAPAFFARERELAARVPPPSPGPAAVVAPGGADAVGMRAALELEAQLAAVAEADRYRARAEHLGPSAAQRLARLDAENAAWRARLDAYLAARDELLQDRQLSDGVRTRRLEELRAPFTAAERGRLPTFERVHDRQRAGAQGEEPAEQR